VVILPCGKKARDRCGGNGLGKVSLLRKQCCEGRRRRRCRSRESDHRCCCRCCTTGTRNQVQEPFFYLSPPDPNNNRKLPWARQEVHAPFRREQHAEESFPEIMTATNGRQRRSCCCVGSVCQVDPTTAMARPRSWLRMNQCPIHTYIFDGGSDKLLTCNVVLRCSIVPHHGSGNAHPTNDDTTGIEAKTTAIHKLGLVLETTSRINPRSHIVRRCSFATRPLLARSCRLALTTNMEPSLATTPYATVLPMVASAENDPAVLHAFLGVGERGRWLRSSCRRGLVVWPFHLPSYSPLMLALEMAAWPCNSASSTFL
jgi:hypothetical protein